jgi:hypothetical protein
MVPFRPIFSLPGRLQRKLKPFLGSSPYNSCFPPELIVLVLPAKTDFFRFPAKMKFGIVQVLYITSGRKLFLRNRRS